ncbi:MAG: hypothetical protein WCP56_02995 [Candidatus Saccharibacteria bacterium]|jgi:hypothetical protein
MQLTCHDCSLPVLATVFLQSEIDKAASKTTSIMGRKADLGYKERSTFLSRGPISSQEIASFHLHITKPQKTNKTK